jgi:hypothetical protein
MHPARKKTVLLLVAAGRLVAALTLVSRRTRPFALPADPAHRDLSGNPGCAPCHAEGAAHPVGPRHPPKDDCLLCHRRSPPVR